MRWRREGTGIGPNNGNTSQWRNGEHLGTPAVSGFGSPLEFYEGVGISQSGFEPLRTLGPHEMRWMRGYTLCCREADGPTNLEKPTLNHVQSDTMASALLADSTRALQGTNRGSGPAMEMSENDVVSYEQLLLYADDHYPDGKLSLGDHLGKVLHGVE
ncbi:15-hydroxyprostaglandin dehydrogenase [Trichonephila clavipes]|nr:15-hydroxyprostaglandin dehydrogenase [Trichonephila clavipes]